MRRRVLCDGRCARTSELDGEEFRAFDKEFEVRLSGLWEELELTGSIGHLFRAVRRLQVQAWRRGSRRRVL